MQARSLARSSLTLAAVAATTLALGASPPARAQSPATPAAAPIPHWDFEKDQPGATPAGCSAAAADPVVTDGLAHGGKRSLLLPPATAGAPAQLNCAATPQRGATLTFWVHPEAATGFTVGLLGTTTAATEPNTAVARVGAGSDGALTWSDGTRNLPIADAGTVRPGQWNRITIGMTTDQDAIHLRVDDREVGSGGPVKIDPITAVTGFTLGSGDGPGRVFVDDVDLGPAQTQLPREIRSQYRIGEKRTIATATEPIQMPSTAVRVPGPPDAGGRRGERIIAMYPAHSDAADTAGNELVASDDGGRSWQDFQAHNPMPDAPSFFMTRLRDGSLLAINYHGYANDNRHESVIESAVSTDDGHTWTTREGVMSAPADLAPYACERPAGCTAIVQVHNVVEGADGTLYQSAYGKYDGDPKYRQLLLTSTDGGLNWGVRSTVAFDPDLLPDKGYEGPCEGALVRTGEHSFLMVMRTGSYLPMYAARSDDDGRTWSGLEQLRTTGNHPVSSVYPTLERLGDGSLVLLAGRPGESLLRSTDEGATWSEPVRIDWTNSANGYLLPMGGNEVMLFGDQGANWQKPKEYGIWNRTVEVVRRR